MDNVQHTWHADAGPVGALPSACQDALLEVSRGLAGLAVAMFLFAWSGSDWAPVLLLVALPFSVGHFVPLHAAIVSPDAGFSRQLRAIFGPALAGWRLVATALMVIALVMLSFARIVELGRSGALPLAQTSAERWFPLLLTTLLPLWFVISGLLYRVPRHLFAGAIGFAGAAAGPLLGLAWLDSLALAAAVISLVLIADGLIARRNSCRSAPPSSRAGARLPLQGP
jgi:hypothetical protein